MSILGNFPAASNKELPECVVGYLYYNDGTKLSLTNVEVIPNTANLLKTIVDTSKPMYISLQNNYLYIVTEDGYYKKIDYDGGVLSSKSLSKYPLTACEYGTIAYSAGGHHYLCGMTSWNVNWTCSEHKAKIINCYGGASGPTLSVDESGVVLCHDGEYTNGSYSHTLKWSVIIDGCVAVSSNYCVAVGTMIKNLSPLDGSVLAEIDTGHNIVGFDYNHRYAYCDDGYVVAYNYSRDGSDADGYTGTIEITKLYNFGKNVNNIYSTGLDYSLVCYVDGTVSKLSLDLETEIWSYKGNTVGALFARAYGYDANYNIVIAREDGTIEILQQTPTMVKVYFNEET